MEGFERITTKDLQVMEMLITKQGMHSDKSKIMLSGVRAYLYSNNANQVRKSLHDKLNQPKGTPKQELEKHIDITTELTRLNAPVDAAHASYVLVGMDILKFTDEFYQKDENKLLSFLILFSIFGLYAVEIARGNKPEYTLPGIQEIINTIPQNECFSQKYNYVMSYFKPLSYLMVLNKRIHQDVESLNYVNSNVEKLEIIKQTKEFLDTHTTTISRLINELSDPSIINNHYQKFLSLEIDLQRRLSDIKKHCKIDIISNAMQSGIFNFILENKHADRFKSIKIEHDGAKVDVFKEPFCSLLYTKPSLSTLRQKLEELFGDRLNDQIIVAIYKECREISKKVATEKSFEERYSGKGTDLNNQFNFAAV